MGKKGYMTGGFLFTFAGVALAAVFRPIPAPIVFQFIGCGLAMYWGAYLCHKDEKWERMYREELRAIQLARKAYKEALGRNVENISRLEREINGYCAGRTYKNDWDDAGGAK